MKYRVVIGCVGVVAIATACMRLRSSVRSAGPGGPLELIRSVISPAAEVAVKPTLNVDRAVVAPTTVRPAEGLPAAYQILLTRSIFSASSKTGKVSAPSAESTLELRGVMQSGAGAVAFVENTAGGQIRLVHVGDTVGRGTITAIDLRYVEFMQGTHGARIAVGQTFGGEPSRIAAKTPSAALPSLARDRVTPGSVVSKETSKGKDGAVPNGKKAAVPKDATQAVSKGRKVQTADRP